MVKRILPILLFISLLIMRTAANARIADFLIVENPAALTIYNQYQQPVNSDNDLVSRFFVPFEIINENDLLSDGITPVMEVRLFSQRFHILKTMEDEISGVDAAGSAQIFRNCAVHGDTIAVVLNNAVYFSRSIAAQEQPLPEGTVLLRLFRKGDRYYVFDTSARQAFGWCRFKTDRAWEPVKPEAKPASAGITADLRERLIARIQSINLLYARYFEHFNRRYNKRLPAPQWQVESGDDRIAFRMGNQKYAEQLSESSAVLRRELQNMLLGTNLELQEQNNAFIISKADGS